MSERMIPAAIAHYQIVEQLGEGGMGVVWKARDTHLDRFVAIKVLPSEAVGSAGLPRLVHEAKAASALTPTSFTFTTWASTTACPTSRWNMLAEKRWKS